MCARDGTTTSIIHALAVALLWAGVLAQSEAPTEGVEVNVRATAYTLTFSLSNAEIYSFVNITCRTGSVEIIAMAMEDGQHVCEKLSPCTSYQSVVELRAEGSEVTSTQTIEASTEYKEPSTKITSLESTAHSVKIIWQTTDRACVDTFKVLASTADGTSAFSTELRNDRSTHTFKDLNSCLSYNITLATYNNNSELVDKDMDWQDTSYSEPGDLTLTIKNLENGQTSITWTEPEHKTCVSNYTFRWQRMNCISDEPTTTTSSDLMTALTTLQLDYATDYTDVTNLPEETAAVCEWEEFSQDKTLKQFVLSDLQGCELYNFDVYINANTSTKASQQFTAAEKQPSAITNPRRKIEPTELHFQWDVPKDHASCVASYEIKLSGPTQLSDYGYIKNSTQDTYIIFDDLDPCGTYRLEITPISLNKTPGAGYTNETTLSEDQPSEILNPEIVPGPFYIKIDWQTPAYANLCIGSYRIVGWMEPNLNVEALSHETSDTNVLFDSGLSSCQAYTIQIIAVTKDKLDGKPRKIEVETQAAIVDSSKVEIQLVNSSPNSLQLMASNQDNSNSCQTLFAHFNCYTMSEVAHPRAESYVDNQALSSGGAFVATLTPLSPYTQYSCDVVLYNVAGPSKQKSLSQRTESYFPEQPHSVTSINQTNTSLQFRWQAPEYPNGQIKLYQAYLFPYEPAYFVPEDCKPMAADPIPVATGNTEYVFNNLLPAIKYSLQVAAQNDYGLGQYTAPLIGITLPTVSNTVTGVNVATQGPFPNDERYNASVTINWTMPCQSNGEIEEFLLQFKGQRNENETSFNRTVPPDTSDKGRMHYVETDKMMPAYNYTVHVAVRTRNVDELSTSVVRTFDAPAGIPARLGEDVVGQMRVNAFETNHPTRSAIVRLPADVLNSESGDINYIALLLSEKSCAGPPERQYDALDSSVYWPEVLSWQEAGGDGSKDCIAQYQTTPLRWQPVVSSRTATEQQLQEIVYVIGEDKCPDQLLRYCNGPLKADTEYDLVVRLFTKSGYSDAAMLEFKTDAAIKVTLILVSVCSCLLLAFVIGLVVLWVRKRIAWHRDSGQGIEDPFGNVIAKNFAIFYEEVSKPEKLAREFKEITVVALEVSYAASELGCHKNRYADIYPYDKNRVMLDIDAEGSDYINASFIDGHPRKKEYIATQGPKPESVMDFWRMVLQHNVRVIVQVTQFREGNVIKCHEYFPYNMRGLVVSIKGKESFELYDRTELAVVQDKYGLKQKVIHFYFKKWPDHGCPEDPLHLINFVRKIKAEKRPNYSPIVVHCSAGVGRTGTLIGLDLIMQRLKSESKINIFETVKKLRFQRMKMVQTLQQYTFLYACTYELVKHKIPRARAALKGADVRPRPTAPAPTPTTSKKVSFPAAEVELTNDDSMTEISETYNSSEATPALLVPMRHGGLRKSKNLVSLHEHPERKSSGLGNGGGDGGESVM